MRRIKSMKLNNEWIICSSKRKSTKILERFHDLMANDMQTMGKMEVTVIFSFELAFMLILATQRYMLLFICFNIIKRSYSKGNHHAKLTSTKISRNTYKQPVRKYQV